MYLCAQLYEEIRNNKLWNKREKSKERIKEREKRNKEKEKQNGNSVNGIKAKKGTQSFKLLLWTAKSLMVTVILYVVILVLLFIIFVYACTYVYYITTMYTMRIE